MVNVTKRMLHTCPRGMVFPCFPPVLIYTRYATLRYATLGYARLRYYLTLHRSINLFAQISASSVESLRHPSPLHKNVECIEFDMPCRMHNCPTHHLTYLIIFDTKRGPSQVAAFVQKWQLAEDEAALRAACAKVGPGLPHGTVGCVGFPLDTYG